MATALTPISPAYCLDRAAGAAQGRGEEVRLAR